MEIIQVLIKAKQGLRDSDHDIIILGWDEIVYQHFVMFISVMGFTKEQMKV